MVWFDKKGKEMTKKSKNKVSVIPDIYKDLEVPTKKVADRAVVLDAKNQWIVFPSKEDIAKFPELQIVEQINSLDDLLSANRAMVEDLHQKVFASGIPKTLDKTQAALYCWAWLVRNAKPLIPHVTKDSEGNEVKRARVSTIGTRIYILGESGCTMDKVIEKDLIKTPQARACYQIFLDTLSRPKEDGDTPHVSEADLRKAIEARAAELKTKQDPWRIFQYYRPGLLAAKLLRHD